MAVDGQYVVMDPSVGKILMSQSALDSEASGYFLVPQGDLPSGWSHVNSREGANVWGKGGTNYRNPNPVPPPLKPPCPMAEYSMDMLLASLYIRDTPVGYSPPRGPDMHFLVSYDHRDPGQPAVFDYSNLGQKWTFNWLSYITDDPNSPGADVTDYTAGGGIEPYTEFNTSNQSYGLQPDSQTILTMTSSNSYTLTTSQGYRQIYSRPDGSTTYPRKVFLTQTLDPTGNTVTYTYDGYNRMVAATDAIGQVSTLTYGSTNINDPMFHQITRVTDPFGRFAQFGYNSTGQLVSITDILGITSQFIYGSSFAGTVDFITSMTTPYGATTFSEDATSLKATDPLGQSEFVQYQDSGIVGVPVNGGLPSTISPSVVPFLPFRISFYWDKQAMQLYPGDQTKAVIYQWLHDENIDLVCSHTLQDTGKPLEGRIWYTYVQTVTDSLGRTTSASYDADDRVTNVAYMDASFVQTVYNYLDPVLQKDRDGYWTAMRYDALRQMTDTYDNIGRHTHFDYCSCGALDGITDPLGNVTTFVRDLEKRVTSKIYPDGTQWNYTYQPNSGRLQSTTDAKGQSTQYQYFIDDNLAQVSYTNASVATPTVYLTYDTNYNRVLTMADGIGITTYSYYPTIGGQFGAGKLYSVLGPFPNDNIVCEYDALGRKASYSINGVEEQLTYDALGRVTIVTNALGTFRTTYIGATTLISTNLYPNGQQTVFGYSSTTNDERLAEIWNQNIDGSTLSKYDYSYDAEGQITNWVQQVDAASPTAFTYQYDAGKQLLSAVLNSTGAGATVLKQYAYGYDLAGNRTCEQIGGGSTGASPMSISLCNYNNVNENTNRIGGSGTMLFAGSLDMTGTVTVNSNGATMPRQSTNFIGYASVSIGTNTIYITADHNGNSQTNKYQVVVTNSGMVEAITFDLNGNETSVATATSTNFYQWDAANRLVDVTGPMSESLFTYDGYGRRTRIIELQNGTIMGTNVFVWDGQRVAEERDATGATVVNRFFHQGEQIRGVNFYFARDHLGSIRQMTDGGDAVHYRSDYDPYGRQTMLQGDVSPDFGYAGMYYHQPSTLNLTLYREYSSDFGRWLSRDPLQESAQNNLFNYVANNPVGRIDPLGLEPLMPVVDAQTCCLVCLRTAQQEGIGVAWSATKEHIGEIGVGLVSTVASVILTTKSPALGIIALLPTGAYDTWVINRVFVDRKQKHCEIRRKYLKCLMGCKKKYPRLDDLEEIDTFWEQNKL